MAKELSPRQASIVDYPHDELPTDLWRKSGDQYEMIPSCREKIVEIVNGVLDDAFKGKDKWFRAILFGSSYGTQFYTPDSDLDFKIIVDYKQLLETNPEYKKIPSEDLQKELVAKVREKEFKLEGHPVDLYVYDESEVLNRKEFPKKYDSIYLVTSADKGDEGWIKPPTLVDAKNFDRERVIDRGKDKAIEWAKGWDIDIGNIKRSIKEYDLIKQHLKTIPTDEKSRFKKEIQKILEDIEKDIDTLSEEKDVVVEERHRIFKEPFEPDFENYYYSINYLPENIQFKLLQRYGYFGLISSLAEYVEDDKKVTEDEVPEIKETIKKEGTLSPRQTN